jgi:hypothetical protein
MMRKTRRGLKIKESEFRSERLSEIACHLKTPPALALQKNGTRPQYLIQDLDPLDLGH